MAIKYAIKMDVPKWIWSLYVHGGPPSIAKLVCNIVTSISQVLFIFQLRAIDLLTKPHGTQGKHRKHGDVFIGGLHRGTVHHRKPLAALRQQCQALGDASGRASVGAWKLVWTCLNRQGNSKINYQKKNLANYSVIVNNWKGRHMGNNGGINAENTGAAWYQETICEYREN